MAAVLAFACQARAESASLQPATAVVVAPAPAGGFEQLSAMQQLIARGLFRAQQASATSPAPLNLAEIAALKTGRTWPAVLKEMRSRGLIAANSLQEVVRDYLREIDGCLAPNRTAAADGTLMIVTGSGQLFAAPGAASRDASGRCAGDEDRRAKSLATVE
jgi:hypothetical protein